MVLSMRNATLQKLIWVLIYGGLLAVVLGLSIQKADDALGWPIVVTGAVLAVAGVVFIFIRARRKDPPSAQGPTT